MSIVPARFRAEMSRRSLLGWGLAAGVFGFATARRAALGRPCRHARRRGADRQPLGRLRAKVEERSRRLGETLGGGPAPTIGSPASSTASIADPHQISDGARAWLEEPRRQYQGPAASCA